MQFTNTTATAASPRVSVRKRGYWRALAAGVVARLLFLALVFLGEWLLRPFVWFALSNEPYDTGPINPNSGEWLFLQLLGFIGSIVIGAVIARWSKPGSWSALTTFSVIELVLVFLGPIPATESLVRRLVWLLGVPVGVLLGGLAYKRREARERHDA